MRYDVDFEAEPFQGYTEFDESEITDYESSDGLSGELWQRRQRTQRAKGRRPRMRPRRQPRRRRPVRPSPQGFRIPYGSFNIFSDPAQQGTDDAAPDGAGAGMAQADGDDAGAAAGPDDGAGGGPSADQSEFDEWEWLDPEASEEFADSFEFMDAGEGEDESEWGLPSPSIFSRYFGGGAAKPSTSQPLPALTPAEQAELARLKPPAQAQFKQLRTLIESYTGVARREADKGSRSLLRWRQFLQTTQLLPEIINLTAINTLPSGWSLATAKPLLIGNVLYNLAFPETINQGGTDRLGGKADPTCFSASTQILLARRFPATYVRLVTELATTSKITFPGGATLGKLTFKSTNLYRSLESVLLQTAFDTYFLTVAIVGGKYTPGDELKVQRQVFGASRPPRFTTWKSRPSMISAFNTAFVKNGGNTRKWEVINLCVGNPVPSCGKFNHTVVLTRVTGGRVYFYNPWANEEERKTMFGKAKVSVSGNGERPGESSMTQADFENQLTAVFHN